MSAPEVLTVAELTAADRASAEAGVSVRVLMERAGTAVAEALQRRWPAGEVVVLCGPGNNGGDGFVAARKLAEAGRSVRVVLLGEREALTGAAAEAAADWTGPVEPLSLDAVEGAAVVVDALFGAGLARPLEGPARETLRRAEAHAPILAVDLPSGLNGDTGAVQGYAPQAALTVTFHRKKPAHLLHPGAVLCGEVQVADIGLPAPADGALFENGPAAWGAAYPWPAVDVHKHRRGRLMVVAGGPLQGGAARLAARGGLRVGAGLVTVLCAPEAAPAHAARLDAVMLRAFETELELEQLAANADACVIGPAAGLGEATVANVEALAQTGAALVLDADALTVFRDEPDELFSMLDRDDVLTPHAGEFERLFPGLLVEAPERISAAREAARRADAVVLLKGPDTVIAAPDGRALINGNGSPWLATAGSGDVLAGFVAGLIAQGMDSFHAAGAAVWLHAEVARRHGPGLIAEDLPERLPAVLADLYAAR